MAMAGDIRMTALQFWLALWPFIKGRNRCIAELRFDPLLPLILG
jgi:hypothetical protein